MVLAVICSAPPVWAQATPYTFTRIADTVHTDAGLGGVYCVGINNPGTVMVSYAPTGSSVVQIWRGDGLTFTQVAPEASGGCFSVNELDEMLVFGSELFTNCSRRTVSARRTRWCPTRDPTLSTT